MRVKLYPFQEKALANIRINVAMSLNEFRHFKRSQVVAYTAPTGTGKTIIMSALIEQIYRGNDQYAEQPDAIVVWLSDSPELNKQSRDKIDLKADQIALGQTVMIDDEGFDCETLEDGKIYFLNTQKIGKDKLLTRHSDSRQYTIWETLRNTAERKSDRLYFIIDEAHRGMRNNAATATTIMQKFLKGTTETEQDSDDSAVIVPPMPIVIGISATIERFNNFVSGINSTIRQVKTTADEVRQSGLLKDRIVITYPENFNNDIAVLQAAVDDWRDKWRRWDTYCREQHYAYVNPMLLVQVQNGSGSQISATDLDVCVKKIEQRAGLEFKPGELVHCFGNTTETLTLAGREVRYVEPSAITGDRNIKVVLFKESLSTGWDCPRAETMMSFRSASDNTYVAQLLGRMVRTPLQKRVLVDDELNDVKLFLPHFDEESVKKVVEDLQASEGSDIAADIYTQSLEKPVVKVYGVRPTVKTTNYLAFKPSVLNNQPDNESKEEQTIVDLSSSPQNQQEEQQGTGISNTQILASGQAPTPLSLPNISGNTEQVQHSPEQLPTPQFFEDNIAREAIIDAINEMGITTYIVRNSKNKRYYPSLFDLVRLLRDVGEPAFRKQTVASIVKMIHDHAESLREQGKYDELTEKVKQFKLKAETFDVFGQVVADTPITEIKSTTDEDLDRQLRAAEGKLGNEGIVNEYGKLYANFDDTTLHAIDIILFVADDRCMIGLEAWAKKRFNELEIITRPKTVKWQDKYKDRFTSIVADSDEITEHNLDLPKGVDFPESPKSIEMPYHLYVDPHTGKAKFDLNDWELGVVNEEMKADNFVCWLRNPSRKSWALTIPYKMNGNKAAYPDLIIIRILEDQSLELSVLEPHDSSRKDNLPKAKGFAEYAAINPGIAHIQLIRKKKDIHGERFLRLELARKDIRELVGKAVTNEQLDAIFDEYADFK